jgi:methyl-accepting chemotaxis protein
MKWFYHLRISRKLLLVFAAICIVMGAVGSVGLWELFSMKSEMESLYQDRLQRIIELTNTNKAISENVVQLMNATQTSQSDIELADTLNTNLKQVDANIKLLSQGPLSKEESNLLATLNSQLTAHKATVNNCIQLAKNNNKEMMLMEINGTLALQKRTIEETLMELVSIQNQKAKELYQETEQRFSQSKNFIIGLIIAGIAISIFFGMALTRLIAGPINQVRRRLAEMAQAGGDLTQRLTIHSRDEVGQLATQFNSMMASIQGIIREVLQHAEWVATTSTELSSKAIQSRNANEEIILAIKEIASGADTQVESITETSRSMNIMSASVQQISANSQEVSSASMETTEIARIGKEIIDSSMTKIEAVNETVHTSADMVLALGEKSQQIGKIIGVITGIASQTNLLALNAAIEAARAAEHGRGFAVVADEVRKLAEESGQAAQQIARVIHEIQQETARVAETMTAGSSDVKEGLAAAKKAKDSFEQIYQAVETVSAQIFEVTKATEQMAAGSESVLHSIHTVVGVAESATEKTNHVRVTTDGSRAHMDDIVSSANALSDMAADLQRLVGQFKV